MQKYGFTFAPVQHRYDNRLTVLYECDGSQQCGIQDLMDGIAIVVRFFPKLTHLVSLAYLILSGQFKVSTLAKEDRRKLVRNSRYQNYADQVKDNSGARHARNCQHA